MALMRFSASADTTITNAFEAGLTTRGTGSNMGYADSLEIFSLYGQSRTVQGQTAELSRALVQFPINKIAAQRTAGVIPAAGSVSFYLKMFNAQTPFTLPQNFNLLLTPVSRSWIEGTGLDMDEYKDLGTSNWMKSDTTTTWTTVGGDYRTGSNYTVSFPRGYENINLDITSLVEKWLAGADPAYSNNYGIGIRLPLTQEAYYSSSTGQNTGSLLNNLAGSRQSYYTKKFFSRSSEFFYYRPIIEARWDSRVSDDRENFFYSSSLAPAADNLNTLYLYNYVRGRLVNIPAVGTNSIEVSLYAGATSTSTTPGVAKCLLSSGDLNATGSWVKTGIYSVDLCITGNTTPLLALFDVWHSGGVQYSTGSIYPELLPTYSAAPTFTQVTSCKNLKKSYSSNDKARFRFFVRNRDWNPTIYVKATANNPSLIITSASYNIRRAADNFNAIPYGTGSDYSTYLSYDKDGNYFDFDMSMLDTGYMYELKLSYYNDSIGDWQEQPQTFKFRVEE